MESYKSYVIITTIFNPTPAIVKYSKMQDCFVTVIGDRKTPEGWFCKNVEFISVDDQEKLNYRILPKLPYNHYSRKMLGYIHAIKNKADIIIDTDDDNIPYNDWRIPEFEGFFDITQKHGGFTNVYKYFTQKHIWPRGFPLDKINLVPDKITQKDTCLIGIWQGLADGDPDVDAIYRLLQRPECFFEKRDPVILGTGTVCPFNSQNTAFRREVFALLYLPAFVNFRFTDILRGLVAQPILWSAGYNLGFFNATVYQERNEHSSLKDFESEIPCYLFAEKVIDLVYGSTRSGQTISDNLFNAYTVLEKIGIVTSGEIDLLELWLEEIMQ